jgi:hypothetical protein
VLQPQDLLVVLRLALDTPGPKPTLQAIAVELGLSASQVHTSVRRAAKSHLLDLSSRTVRRSSLLEFLLHGVKYSFPAEADAVTRGIPTAHAAPPLSSHISSKDMPPVWPHPEGTVRGEAFAPLHRAAPDAALKNPRLYELLSLVDAIRGGRARERTLASQELEKRLKP